MTEIAKPQFNIHNSNEFTLNVEPIMHQIYHALQNFIGTGEASIIDLRSIPLAPSEEETIIDMLGRGEVYAQLNALDPSKIYETQYAGVWLVTHYNEANSIISRFIEITELPDILKSQYEDMTYSLQKLAEKLEIN
jgi:hydrogenase-1 operon protein HyaF